MEKITSFTIDHIRLQPGLYVSRKDAVGAETVTTFDLRVTKPNDEPVMNTAEVHTIEHLGTAYLQSLPEWKDRIISFSPMGCRSFLSPWKDEEGNTKSRVYVFAENIQILTPKEKVETCLEHARRLIAYYKDEIKAMKEMSHYSERRGRY